MLVRVIDDCNFQSVLGLVGKDICLEGWKIPNKRLLFTGHEYANIFGSHLADVILDKHERILGRRRALWDEEEISVCKLEHEREYMKLLTKDKRG